MFFRLMLYSSCTLALFLPPDVVFFLHSALFLPPDVIYSSCTLLYSFRMMSYSSCTLLYSFRLIPYSPCTLLYSFRLDGTLLQFTILSLLTRLFPPDSALNLFLSVLSAKRTVQALWNFSNMSLPRTGRCIGNGYQAVHGKPVRIVPWHAPSNLYSRSPLAYLIPYHNHPRSPAAASSIVKPHGAEVREIQRSHMKNIQRFDWPGRVRPPQQRAHARPDHPIPHPANP